MAYKRPGVYIQETTASNQPVTGVSTSVAGFLGITRSGPKNKATMVTSWADFCNKFAYGLESAFSADSYLPYSVYGFFANGGQKAYIVRVLDESTAVKSSSVVQKADASPLCTISALYEGSYGDNIKRLLKANGGAYDLIISYNDVVVAEYKDVNFNSASAKFIEKAVNGVDKYVSVTVAEGGGAPAPSELGAAVALAGGNDGITAMVDSDFTDHLDAFNEVEDLNILVIPDSQSQTVIESAVTYVEGRQDCVFLFEGEEDDTTADAVTLKASVSSKYAAMYWPWIKIIDPISTSVDKTKNIPASGHIAGVMARIDANAPEGVYRAPAGTDAYIVGAIGTSVDVTDTMQEELNPIGINAIRYFKNDGVVIWGAKTCSNEYLNIRRGLNYIKTSLKNGTRWAAFKPNNSALYRKITVAGKAFLLGEFYKGGFKGDTPAEAFFVKCDDEINTPDTVSRGELWAEYGVAIAEPGEFVILKVGQWSGGKASVVEQ